MLCPGDTFFFCAIPKRHLWLVISDPASYPNDPVVIVSLRTYRPNLESTCVLNPGDHAFVTHKTVVDYGNMRMHPRGRLDGLARAGRLDMREPMDPEVLQRVRMGAFASKRVAGKFRRVLAGQGLSGST